MQTIRLSRYCRFERNKHVVIFFYNAVFISKIKGKNFYQEGKCWTAKCIVGCIYRISCVCHRTTGTNAYRYANIVRHIPKPNRVAYYFVVTWFLSPLTSIYIWNYYLCGHSHAQELPGEMTKLQDLIFLCLQLVWTQIFVKNELDIWPLLTLTCGYILVVVYNVWLTHTAWRKLLTTSLWPGFSHPYF